MELSSAFSLSADIVSWIGFGTTIWIAIQTKAIKKSFVSKARTPEIRKNLAQTIKKLTVTIENWPDNKNDTLNDLIKIRGLLENLQHKLSKNQRGQVITVLHKINGRKTFLSKISGKRNNINNYTKDDIWEIHRETQAIVTALEENEKDSNWE